MQKNKVPPKSWVPVRSHLRGGRYVTFHVRRNKDILGNNNNNNNRVQAPIVVQTEPASVEQHSDIRDYLSKANITAFLRKFVHPAAAEYEKIEKEIGRAEIPAKQREKLLADLVKKKQEAVIGSINKEIKAFVPKPHRKPIARQLFNAWAEGLAYWFR